MSVTFVSPGDEAPGTAKIPAGHVRCEQTGCIIPESECDAHARAYGAEQARAALDAPPPSAVETARAAAAAARAVTREALDEVAKLKAELDALKAGK